jgi:hypothetical protein
VEQSSSTFSTHPSRTASARPFDRNPRLTAQKALAECTIDCISPVTVEKDDGAG